MRVLVVCMRTVGKGGCFTYLGQGGHVQCLTGGVNGRARITNAMRGAGGRTSYNVTIQQTNNEQMLLNLIRLRYCDTPYFLDVSAITSQFSQKGKIAPSFTLPGFDQANPFKFGAEYEWQNQPTLSYTPLEGSSFSKQLMQPIDLTTLQRIIYSGWNIERVFRVAVQNIDNLPNARGTSGPVPECVPDYERFLEVSRLLGYFQRRGELLIGVTGGKKGTGANGGCAKVIQMSFPTGSAKAEQLANLLDGTKASAKSYYIDLPVGFTKQQEIGILPRSILGCMYHLSLAVDVPPEHLYNGAVVATRTADGNIFDWSSVIGNLLHIYSSASYPSNAAVAIRYRDYWFYISNYDVMSKRTFALLMQLYNLQQGDVATTAPPVLTIPIGV